jgi:hypothetical protein
MVGQTSTRECTNTFIAFVFTLQRFWELFQFQYQKPTHVAACVIKPAQTISETCAIRVRGAEVDKVSSMFVPNGEEQTVTLSILGFDKEEEIQKCRRSAMKAK